MATPKAIIDTVVSFYDDADDTVSSELTPRRNRLLQMLNHVHRLVWHFRPWAFTYKESPITTDAESNAIPFATKIADFLALGPEGFVIESARHLEYREVSKAAIQRRRNVLQVSAPLPIFAIFDDGIQFDAEFASATDFMVFHRYKPPALVYDTTEMVFPDAYTDTVLIPALVYRSQVSKRDNRSVWGDQFKEGLDSMCVTEAPKQSTGQKMPISHRGAW